MQMKPNNFIRQRWASLSTNLQYILFSPTYCTLIYKHKILSYEIFDKKNQPSPIANSKEIHTKIDRCGTGHKPSAHHPWRQYNQIAISQRQRI